MNIILAEQKEVNNGRVLLKNRRADHVVNVLRAKEGDIVRFGILNGQQGVGTILKIEKKHPRSVELAVELNRPMSSLPRIDLIIALARPIMMRRILSQATALGVGRFHVTHANRVEKSFWEATMLEQETYHDHLIQGLEQSVDTRLPDVLFHRRFKPFVEDYLPAVMHEYSHLILAHPAGDKALAKTIGNEAGRILLAIGPEGGWVDYEVGKFKEAGFSSCSIGSRILKVDTAVIALHARISEICGD